MIEFLMGLGIIAIIASMGLGIFLFIFWIAMMISAIKNQGISETARWVWIGIMLGSSILYGIGWIVAIVYYFTDRKKNKLIR